MSKSREFDNILNECLERLLVKGEGIEQCLQNFPAHANELRPLLKLALAARKAADIQPRLDFREKARNQFYAALQARELRPSRRFLVWNWQPRWATVLAIILAILLAGGGTVTAANAAMPDQPLYPVKLATEQVGLAFNTSAWAKAEFYTRLADRRVAEMVRMASENKTEWIGPTSRRMNYHLSHIAELASNTGNAAAGTTVSPELGSAGELGKGIAVTPPIEGVPPRQKLHEPGIPPIPELRDGSRPWPDRRAKLRERVVGYALAHPARLRALLEKVPDEARPALLQAILASEMGYEKALQSLK